MVGALGAGLVAMVARITLGAPQRKGYHDAARTIVERADRLRARFREAGVQDEAAFAEVTRAQRLPRATNAEREARALLLEQALARAAEVPLGAAQLANELLGLCLEAAALEHRALASDVGCAAEFALSALRACAYNVRVNHRYMKDAATIARQSAELGAIEREADASIVRVRSEVEALLA